ncbi:MULTISPECIES: hypothetical protein [unclassified Nocardia]|uniref:poly(ethylene terephthalate) hydrolase family protein n=1 Tax=unclassified Nocardia TaxID=2637762 RepID=UPI00278C8982|nr:MULTISPECIES: hypothetical protein [unclassified Nocardia]
MRIWLTAVLSLLLLTAAPARADAPTADGVTREPTRVGGDTATVWYPSRTEHRLPIALMLPGANVRGEYYSRFATALAGYGFVVVIPERYPLPGYSLPSEHSVTEVVARARAADPASAVGAVVDPETLLLAGHSYGGAAAVYAAADRCQPPFCFGVSYRRPAQLKAVVGHGTNTTIGSTVDAVDVHGIPVLYINGTEDGVSELAEARDSFASLTGAPAAQLVELLGANHFGLTDRDNPPGAAPDPQRGSAPRADTIAAAARWTAMWFHAHLGNAAAAAYVTHIGPRTDTAVRVASR